MAPAIFHFGRCCAWSFGKDHEPFQENEGCVFVVRGAGLTAMKCAAHHSEAIGVCVHCGRALCAECSKLSASQRLICSDACAAALARNDEAMQLILQKSLQNARASAFYLFLCAVLSAGGAICARYYLPSPFLIWFCVGCSMVFAASGIWYGSISGKSSGCK